jgi:hypothetical protein
MSIPQHLWTPEDFAQKAQLDQATIDGRRSVRHAIAEVQRIKAQESIGTFIETSPTVKRAFAEANKTIYDYTSFDTSSTSNIDPNNNLSQSNKRRNF